MRKILISLVFFVCVMGAVIVFSMIAAPSAKQAEAPHFNCSEYYDMKEVADYEYKRLRTILHECTYEPTACSFYLVSALDWKDALDFAKKHIAEDCKEVKPKSRPPLRLDDLFQNQNLLPPDRLEAHHLRFYHHIQVAS